MTELMTALEAKKAASNATANTEKEGIAKSIEIAANKGKFSVIVPMLSDELKAELQKLGYVVAARMNFTQVLGFDISWDSAEEAEGEEKEPEETETEPQQ